MSKGLQIALGALCVCALLGWAAQGALREDGALASFVYYQTLGEFAASAPGERVRVHGYVSPGSIERDVPGKQVRFQMQEHPPHAEDRAPDAAQLAVLYTSLETPDLFLDGAEVVVEGRRAQAGGPFVASNLLAKCPSKFEAAAAAGVAPPKR